MGRPRRPMAAAMPNASMWAARERAMWSIATAITTIMNAKSCIERGMKCRWAAPSLFAVALLLGACGNGNALTPAANADDPGYYTTGNCFDSGRVGYSRDY